MKATTLRQLSQIRQHNRELLNSIETDGTALGRKNGNGDPAILVFVKQKVGEPWLRSGQALPKTLTGPGPLTCPTDVISGSIDRDLHLKVFDSWEGDRGLRPLQELFGTNPLGSEKLKLRDRLWGNTAQLLPGCQLSFRGQDGRVSDGTLACFARDRSTQRRGFLTNQHIGEFPGNLVFFPGPKYAPVGVFQRGVLLEDLGGRYGQPPATMVDPWLRRVRVDAGFCEIHPHVDWNNHVNVQLPVVGPNGTTLETLGQPLPLDLDTMVPVGEAVVGVGRSRTYQTGTIQAFAFEYINEEEGHREFCDYRIVGDNDDEFSDPGDSGKLIVTKKDHRPVAIMWGGEWSRRRHGRDLENWTSATDINLILDRLDVDLVLS